MNGENACENLTMGITGMSKGQKVAIFDTTLRDGEQAAGSRLSSPDKLTLARQLARLKVDVIEAGYPASSPEDFEAVKRIAQESGGWWGEAFPRT